MNSLSAIHNKFIQPEQVSHTRSGLKGKKIIFTNGCFDILHAGHIQYLCAARDLGDVLWIGLNSDESVRKLKGITRPVNNLDDRAMLLASLFFVDLITPFYQSTPIELLSLVKPDIHVKGGDYVKEDLPEYQTVVENGGKIEILQFIAGKSTSGIIQKIQNS